MQRLRAILQKYAHLMWWGSLGLLSVIAVTALVMFFVAGRSEGEDAFAEGRRLIFALDTGEMKGKRITLDKPVTAGAPETPPPVEEATPAPAPETPAADTPPPAAASETPPAEEQPQPVAETPAETPSETAAATEPPPPPSTTPTAAANSALTEEVNGLRLPTIGKDGAKPWRYYSKPYERTRNQPMVAIVVTGLGLSAKVTQEALYLPENFSFSFSAYVRNASSWFSAVRSTGHELLVDLPLQPANYPASDPGPNALLIEKGPAEAEKTLQWSLSRFPAFIGAVTPVNESFTANDDAIKMLLQSFANRGLLMIMSKEPYRKETREIIDATTNTAVLVAGVMIDEDPSIATIQQRLTQLEEQAKRNGYAVGVAQAYPVTIKQLKEWSAKLEEKGVVLVPVSTIAKLRFS